MRLPSICICVAAVLSGCGGSDRGAPGRSAVPASITLASGAVAAVGPQGYCVDTALSRPANGFAVLASCSALSGAEGLQNASGIITVQTGAAGSGIVTGAEDTLMDLLRSEGGRAILSANGVADDIQIDSLDSQTGVVLVNFRDAGAPAIAGAADTEWRAFVDLSGRLTTIGVRGFANGPISVDTGLRVLSETLRQMQTRNQ